MCISRLCARMPMRNTPIKLLVKSTTCLNSSRLDCCFAVRGLRTWRGRALRHHCPRHS